MDVECSTGVSYPPILVHWDTEKVVANFHITITRFIERVAVKIQFIFEPQCRSAGHGHLGLRNQTDRCLKFVVTMTNVDCGLGVDRIGKNVTGKHVAIFEKFQRRFSVFHLMFNSHGPC